MKRITYLITASCFIFTFTSCSKLKEKSTTVTLDKYLSDYDGLQAITKEKAALDVKADKFEPAEDTNLVELTKVLGNLYTVYTTEIPLLIEREKEMRATAINQWKERNIKEMPEVEQTAVAAFNELEVNALRDLLATKIKANEISKERFITLNLMANQLKAQAEALIEQSRNVDSSTQAQLLIDQKSFNQFGTFIQDEQRWVMAHPPIENNEELIQQWRMDHTDSEKLDQALESFQNTYE